MTTNIDDVLEKACSTEHGRAKATIIASRLAKLGPAFANEATRPAVEAHLEQRIASGSELEKGMATAWLANARNAVAGAGKAAVGAVRSLPGKAGDLGAAAGEKLARSPVGAKSLAAASEKGGAEAADRMRAKLAPGAGAAPRRAPGFLEPSAEIAPRAAGTRPGPGFVEGHRSFSAEQRFKSGNPGSLASTAERVAAGHEAAIQGAHAAGSKAAAEAHVGAAARQGRVIARHAFHAGVAVAAGGAGLAGLHGSLSEAQRRQRSEAGKHSHQGGGSFGKSADFEEDKHPRSKGGMFAAAGAAALGAAAGVTAGEKLGRAVGQKMGQNAAAKAPLPHQGEHRDMIASLRDIDRRTGSDRASAAIKHLNAEASVAHGHATSRLIRRGGKIGAVAGIAAGVLGGAALNGIVNRFRDGK